MIRNEAEYQEALRRTKQDHELAQSQRAALLKEGLSEDETDRAMQPLLSFQAQLGNEIAWYERVRRGDIPAIQRLTHLGRQLIALRIASRLTQRELAEVLGVAKSVVSRDERNEYHGITIERAQHVLDVTLGSSTFESNSGWEAAPRRGGADRFGRFFDPPAALTYGD